MVQPSTRLDQQFTHFSKFNDSKSDGRTITLTKLDKWLKQAQLIDKHLTMTDTGICFNKFRSRTISYSEFLVFLEDLSARKNIPLDEIKFKLVDCGLPGFVKPPSAGAEKVKKTEP